MWFRRQEDYCISQFVCSSHARSKLTKHRTDTLHCMTLVRNMVVSHITLSGPVFQDHRQKTKLTNKIAEFPFPPGRGLVQLIPIFSQNRNIGPCRRQRGKPRKTNGEVVPQLQHPDNRSNIYSTLFLETSWSYSKRVTPPFS